MTALKVVNLYSTNESNSVALLLEDGEKVYFSKTEFLSVSKGGVTKNIISENGTIYAPILILKKNGDKDFYIVVAVKKLN